MQHVGDLVLNDFLIVVLALLHHQDQLRDREIGLHQASIDTVRDEPGDFRVPLHSVKAFNHAVVEQWLFL